MNRQLSMDEVALLERSFPVVEAPMTRREKLLRFANLVRKAQHTLGLFHNLEYMDDYQLSKTYSPFTAFAVAANDPAFQKEGLKDQDALSVKKFFELTTAQLHEFSCDCGGQINNEIQADRIEKLAR